MRYAQCREHKQGYKKSFCKSLDSTRNDRLQHEWVYNYMKSVFFFIFIVRFLEQEITQPWSFPEVNLQERSLGIPYRQYTRENPWNSVSYTFHSMTLLYNCLVFVPSRALSIDLHVNRYILNLLPILCYHSDIKLNQPFDPLLLRFSSSFLLCRSLPFANFNPIFRMFFG